MGFFYLFFVCFVLLFLLSYVPVHDCKKTAAITVIPVMGNAV
jgi:hypothetical protein